MDIGVYKKGSMVRAKFVTSEESKNTTIDGKKVFAGTIEDNTGKLKFVASPDENNSVYKAGSEVFISGTVVADANGELYINAYQVRFSSAPERTNEPESNSDEEKKKTTQNENSFDEEFDAIYDEIIEEETEELERSTSENQIAFQNELKEKSEKIKAGCKSIKGQERVVSQVIDRIQSKLLVGTKGVQPQTFLFVGPPGTGKSELAKLISSSLDIKREPLVLDMNDYVDAEDSSSALVGISATWKSAASGKLTSYVMECNEKDEPFVIICDELEKAHTKVINLFIGILENGLLQDKYLDSLYKMKKQEAMEKVSGGVYERIIREHWDDEVKDTNCYFNKAIIFFTSNAGKNIYDNPAINISLCTPEQVIQAVGEEKDPVTDRPVFSNAILSRLGSEGVYMFNNIGAYALIDIAKDNMMNHEAVVEGHTGYDVIVENSNDLAVLTLLGMGGKGSARIVRKKAQEFVTNSVTKVLNAFPTDEKSIGKKIIIKIADDEREKFTEAVFGKRNEVEGFDVDTAELLIVNPTESVKYAFPTECYENVDIAISESFTAAEKKLPSYKYSNPMIVLYVSAPEIDNIPEDYLYELSLRRRFIQYKRFIQTISNVKPNAFICVVSEVALSQQSIYEFYKLGVTKIIDKNQVEELGNTIEEIRLASAAFNFERKNQHLEYEIVPKALGDDYEVRLTGFVTKPNLELSADGGFITEDRMPNVSLEDYTGAEDIKGEVAEFIQFLRNPKIYARKGIEAPKALLLYGPPGTGKTYLAKAVAHDAGVPFFTYNGGDLKMGMDENGKHVGTTTLVKNAFKRARKYAPAILFLDEFDAIAKIRGFDREADAVVNTLLSEMDGFEDLTAKPIVIIGATNKDVEYNGSNYADYIDDAVVSRFTRKFYKGLPSEENRRDFLLSKTELTEEELVTSVALSLGMSFREMSAAIELAKRKHNKIDGTISFTKDELQDAIETINYGEAKKSKGKDKEKIILHEREVVAYHEAGHAAAHCIFGNIPDYATITGRGNFGGYVQTNPDEGKGTYTKKDIENRIISALAGRVGEILRFGTEDGLSTGPSQDIKNAYSRIVSMICAYGMDDEIGITYYNIPRDPKAGTVIENLPSEVQKRVNELFKKYYDMTFEFLEVNRGLWETLAKELLTKTFLTHDDMEKIVDKYKKN